MQNDFTHLHVHTEYSLLDGHSRIKNLTEKAKELGMTSLAITDHGHMYGVVPFYNACRDAGIKPIIGVELYTADDMYDKSTRNMGHLILLAKNNEGYHNLLKICSKAATDGLYYHPRCDLRLLRKYHEGIICLSACIQGDVPRLLLEGKEEEAEQLAAQYKEIFGDDYYIELQYHKIPDERKALKLLVQLARKLGIQMVATNDVHYVLPEDAEAQWTLMCMSMKKTVDDPTIQDYRNPPELYLKSAEEMHKIFDGFAPEAITNTQKIADMCNVEIEMGVYKLPEFPLPEGETSNRDHFRKLCYEGLERRYGALAEERRPQLDYEMGVIEKMGFVDYFLIVADIIQFAKDSHIPIGPGRGSSAGSMVAYCTNITDIEPVQYGLLFERFLNPERITMPDVDIDIAPDGRDLVVAHINEKYGADHIAQIITYGTLAAKSAIRDVAKAWGMELRDVLAITKLVPNGPQGTQISIAEALEVSPELAAKYNSDAKVKKVLDIAMSVEGLGRHTGIHAAGLVIAPGPLVNYLPVQKDAKTGQLVTQFDMGSVEGVGMLKVDLLGLKTLTVLKHAEDAVNEFMPEGEKLDLNNIPLDDERVYEMLSRGETTGVFQFESPGMRDLLRNLRPNCINDLVAAISLYRPGPMDSIPHFIECKHDPSKVTYLHPMLEPILKDTYSTIVYQEQVMRIVRDLAGYSYARSDLVRRAMSKKKKAVMEAEREVFINGSVKDGKVEVDGCVRRGVPAEVGDKLWNQMSDFASYAFNRSHAACYAVMAYRTAYMRLNYPLQFIAALMTNAIGDNKKEKMLSFFADCEKLGIPVLPPDINASGINFTVENYTAIRFGLLAIKDTGSALLAEIIMERNLHGPYTSLQDLIERTVTSANSKTMTALIESGAMDAFQQTRAEMLDILPKLLKAASKARKELNTEQLTLESAFFTSMEESPDSNGAIRLPEIAPSENITQFTKREMLDMEMKATGLYISGHPMDDYEKDILNKVTHRLYEFTPAEDGEEREPIPDGTKIRVAGLVTIVRPILTKKKSQMAFLTIEDKLGKAEITVFPRVYESYGSKLTVGTPVLVFGTAQASDDYGVKIIADSFSFLDDVPQGEEKTNE